MFLNLFNDITSWIKINAYNLVITIIIILIAIVILVFFKFITGKIKKIKNKRTYTVLKLVESILKYIIVLITFFVILGIWGFDVTEALVGVGIVILVIGLGAQDLIKDLIAGIGIVIDEQYDIDEIIEINGFKGKVLEIGLRTTKLVNTYGEIKTIRNGSITEVSNFSRTFSVAIVKVNISHSEDIDRVITLLDEDLPSIKENYPQIIEGPIVTGVDNLTDNSVTLKITAKTECEEHYKVQRALLKRIKELFETKNIKIPYNKIVVCEEKTNE